MTEIQSYLKAMVDVLRLAHTHIHDRDCLYFGQMDVVLRHGLSWTPFAVHDFARGEPKQCFANSQRLALEHPELTYVEGYAASVIPLHHAWCVTADGDVVDVTWDAKPREYFGVPFLTDYVRHTWLRTSWAVALLDNWQDDPPQPIVSGRHPATQWLQPWPALGRSA